MANEGKVAAVFPRARTLGKDEYYQVIVDGVARLFDDPFLHDLARTLVEFTDAANVDLADALGKNQIASKKWLIDRLAATGRTDFDNVYLLGGWYGLFGAMLLRDPRFRIGNVKTIDVDPACAAVAESLCRSHVAAGRFEAVTADINDIDYGRLGGRDLLVNTSCEHIADIGAWFAEIPAGILLAVQSNDQYDDPEHVNCVPDIETLKGQVPLARLLYEGQLALKRYTRFMLIGVK